MSLYLTADPNDLPAEETYIIQTRQKPTLAAWNNGKIKLKQWLKGDRAAAADPATITHTWRGNFAFVEEDRDAGVNGLRQPQLGAIYSVLGHLKLPVDTGIVVLPTGTGKTETMLAVLIANQCQKLLVIVPSDALRTQIAEKFIMLGLLKEFGIVGSAASYPAVGIMRQSFADPAEFEQFVRQSNVVVATMAILQTLSPAQLKHLATECSHVFIDEAHHVKATSWQYVKDHFDGRKVLQFTATPFRNDGQRLEGNILFNFPLSEAQRQGYYKTIEFKPVSVFKPELADQAIADVALARLREDLAAGHNHILMARCSTKERARQVYKLYAPHADLNPVLLYSGMAGAKETLSRIVGRQARIIVCVNMLGEGFDLPELKIAAFHDIRKSLPITLQLAGRFTRTKFDEQLGNACFIANIADPDVGEELDDLYASDANWNQLLANMGQARISEAVDFNKLLAGFSKLDEAKLPIANIKIKLSTVVYRNPTDTWHPANFAAGLPDYDKAFYKFDDLNRDDKLLLILTAHQQGVDWLDSKEVYQLTWRIIVVFWDTRLNLLFINSSDNSSLYEPLAQAIIGKGAQLIRGVDVFKTFDGLHRINLQNVGLRNHLGKNIRFRMLVGRDLEEAVSLLEQQKGEKTFVMGTGYENGKQRNQGASYKGRIWLMRENNLSVFTKWCSKIGKQLLDNSIDPNQFLKATLVPVYVREFPPSDPVWIDWHEDLYAESEVYYKFRLGTELVDLSCATLELTGAFSSTTVDFVLASDTQQTTFRITLQEAGEPGAMYPHYAVTQLTGPVTHAVYGRREVEAAQFLQQFPPTVWFADGSSVQGNDHLALKQSIGLFPAAAIEAWDWTGVDISAESQGVLPITDSVQYRVIQELQQEDYDIIYDDDSSGEAADVVTIKLHADKIAVELFHLKYAQKGKVGKAVKNLYEVCGQTQRSVHWKHRRPEALFQHLLRRDPKTKKGVSRSRLEKGTLQDLENLKRLAKRQLPVEFAFIIVQPSISQANVGDEILKLLGVTQNFVHDLAGVPLRVIGSA
ncbi:DEAD/DEAH box helicase family protein [Hymenobacter sp. NST-14]|uniref:DEAD/DEAH box helicase n=1 Tax=Hymenobacter piscis TaxID=2839984 RepID=UPI001C01EE62|nr:DEAD/DEAH box helicase family protein [Hymenobacter piscis]MBT9395049.1 DEAD/DEAH box helicase family protein [Hymenobacter piscis]